MSQNGENSEKKVTKASKNKETKNAKTNKTTKTKKAMTNKKTTKAKKETKITNKSKKSKNSKKEMAIKIGFVILGVILIVVAINLYKFIVSGNQQIKINTSSKAYANSDMYVSVVAQKDNTDLETKTKIKLKDSKGKNVKGTKVSYEGNEAKISIPDVEGGQYTLEAKVSSKEGKDTVKKDIYISKGNEENSIITLDKGIYKPGDTVNYRAMIINRKDDSPVVEDVNVSIYDGNENKVYNENTKTSDYGIVSGSFQLANEVNSGTYKVITKTESSETTKEFKVNPYVTPKYEVKINYDKDNYLVGDTAKININAKYFFGEPVAHAKVKVNVSEANGASVTLDKEESNSKQNTSNNNTNNTSSNTTNSNVNNTSSNTTNSNENNNSEQTETGKYEELETDDQGNATLEYSITKATSYNVNVEAVDSSNYYVESSNTFTAGTYIFEIDLLPEYGNLVSGNKNNVYVFTHKADGTPVKTYVTVVSDGYNKQVATDDNGIGQFSIDVGNSGTYSNNNSSYSSNKYNTDYQNNVYSKQFTITAENTEKQKVEKKKSLNIEKRNILLSTDKVKYEQGEDIKLNIQSISTNNQNVYFFKNNRLLKMLNTEMKETTVNLGDEYGLIDIYIPEAQGNYSSSNNLNNTKFYKRTVFIKPKKQLNISVNTDKEEYKPGDKISISIDTKDENNNSVDAALLVSMLDNSVLELANNDLSIDNIKLALQNIQFSDDLDAATLYSCIIDDKSEQSMMALLLKQNATNPDISQTIANNINEKENALSTTITWGIVFVVITLIIASLKVKNFKKFLKHVVNFFIFEVWLFCIIVGIMYNLPRSNGFTWVHLIILVSLGLAAYIGVIARYSEKIFRTSIALVISYGLLFLSNYIYIFNLDYETRKSLPSTILAIISVIFLLCVIATAVSKRKKSEWYDALRPIMRTIIYIIRFAIILVLSYFLTAMIANTFSIFSDATLPIVLLITIIYLFDLLINAIINKGFYEKMKKYVKSKFKSKEDVVFFVVSCLAVIGFVALISLGIMVFRNASDVAGGNGMAGGYTFDSKLNSGSSYKGSINGSTSSGSSSSHSSGGGLKPGDIAASDSVQGTGPITTMGSGILGGGFDFFSGLGGNSAGNSSNSVEQSTTVATTEQQKVDEVKDNNVRNVFLESMCFIPELVTSNGNAKTELELSDNITTWTIQTVGNTKDGRVGYGSKNDVKVFKEFFADFELPKNLVEGDYVSIPVTVYNYTENPISTTLKIEESDWFKLDSNNINVNVEPKSTNMVYIPLTVTKSGTNKFRTEVTANELTDIVEKECTISPKGYKVEKVISTGNLSGDVQEDILVLEDIVENTAKAKVKIYSGPESQAIEGMEKIFQMPSGCFEQVSSTLYPNILALKYLENTKLVDENIKTKATSYITSGYQKLLTYEVKGESGGYSLYGKSPAETVLTAYGLMELKDLSEVYNVDNSVLDKMTNYLYGKQKSGGDFEITGSHVGGASARDDVSLTAYITWALSEKDPKDNRINKSIEYLKGKINGVKDNYTLALIANALVNVDDKKAEDVLKTLVNNVGSDGAVTSNVVDYYGSRGNVQNIQTTALTSMALSKKSYAHDANRKMIEYLIKGKDISGTWHSTQATVLALKAINANTEKNKLENQNISVKVNSEEQKIEIKDNPLEMYELTFNNLGKENKLNIDMEKGEGYYEVVEEYYVPYDKVDTSKDNIEIQVQNNNTNLNVNDVLQSNIKVINRSDSDISNGMVKISIPQGFVAVEESLMELESKGIIEKYETNYTDVNIYLREFGKSQVVDLNVEFRASYPVRISGLGVKAYDYYNPTVEGKTMPIEINVN